MEKNGLKRIKTNMTKLLDQVANLGYTTLETNADLEMPFY